MIVTFWKMGNTLLLFLLFCTIMISTQNTTVEEEMNKALESCLSEYNITVHDLESTAVDLSCFDTCIVLKVGMIKDKKFDMERYKDYLLSTQHPNIVDELIRAYQYCSERMLDIEDECDSYLHLEKCVDKQLDYGYKKY